MGAATRRGPLLVPLAMLIIGAAHAQTVCDQLLPIGVVPPAGGFQVGCAFRYTLKPAFLPVVPGAWLALAYPPCPIGPCADMTDVVAFVCAMTNDYACCIGATQDVRILPGAMLGPFRSGLDKRFSSDTDTLRTICYSEYRGNGARITILPLLMTPTNSDTLARIVGFQPLFLVRSLPSADLLVEFIAGPTPVRNASWGRTKVRYR